MRNDNKAVCYNYKVKRVKLDKNVQYCLEVGELKA